MIDEVMQIIKNRKKAIYKDLNSKKKIRPEGYFIIQTDDKYSDVRIPGIESYFTSDWLKDQLVSFVASKWAMYSAKMPMTLIAVVLIVDSWWIDSEDDPGYESNPTGLSTHPKSKEAIAFSIYENTNQYTIYFPYVKQRKHVIFLDERRGGIGEGSRFHNLFPKN